MSDAATITTRAPGRPFRSKRLLALAGDDRLVEQIRRGNELAFEVAFERHGAGILAFCRHMLGSREEAEDAVQHTFAAAFRDLGRGGERRIALKPWLYTIARNRCVSLLRARREQTSELHDIPTDGLSEQVERRAELRELLADVRELPDEQRAALLLAEAAGLSHAEVAQVLGCEVGSVKGLVFRARSALIERRTARETPCTEIREQLATLRGGALRRNELRHHLRDCPGCTAYREEVRRQRQMFAVALPVAPTMGLKSSVLGAVGISGGAAGGGAVAGSLGSAAIAKVAMAGVLAGGGAVAADAVVERVAQDQPVKISAPAASDERGEVRAGERGEALGPPTTTGREHGARISGERNHGQRGAERRAARSRGHGNAGLKSRSGGQGQPNGGRRLGLEKRGARADGPPAGGVRSLERRSAPAEPKSRPTPEPKAAPAPRVQSEPPPPEVEPIVVPEPVPAPLPVEQPGKGKAAN